MIRQGQCFHSLTTLYHFGGGVFQSGVWVVDAIGISQKGWQATLEYSSPHVTKYSYSGNGTDMHHICIHPVIHLIQVKYTEAIFLAR